MLGVYTNIYGGVFIHNKLLCLCFRGVCSGLSHIPAQNCMTQIRHKKVSLKHQSLRCKKTMCEKTVFIFLFSSIRRNPTNLKLKRVWQGKNVQYFHMSVRHLSTKLSLPSLLWEDENM